MQKMMGYMRRAVTQYGMIDPGDRVAVGVSGGKDSLVLLAGLSKMRKFLDIPFEVVGVTIDPGFGGVPGDFSAVERFCEELGTEYHVIRTEIGPVIFDIRKEANPCSLCARMRRGSLHDAAVRLGCKKIALGHHRDDAVETLLMNLFHEGRLGSFSPKSYLSRKDVTLIRPLIMATEEEIRGCAQKLNLPVGKNPCPADGHTEREEMKRLLTQLEAKYPGLRNRMMGAMQRSGLSGF